MINWKKNLKSFTLIEAIVAIFVFTFLMIIVSGSVIALYRTHSYGWQQSLAVDEARRGIEIMVKEIREAREGENGAYPIEYAADKEFIFYSDVDNDGKTERVRYFLGQILTQTLIQQCFTNIAGGSCSVNFSDFLTGNLTLAQVTISVEGDLGRSNEYVDVYLDGQYLGRLCQSDCADCAGTWQGTQTFNILSQAEDGNLNFIVDASNLVNCGAGELECNWEGYHTMKAKFEFTFSQEIQGTELKKGVIKPVGFPPTYPQNQETVSIITSYVRNTPPIFGYFDKNGNKIEDYHARLIDTKVMRVFLVINVDPNRPPNEYQLESYVELRNLKNE